MDINTLIAKGITPISKNINAKRYSNLFPFSRNDDRALVFDVFSPHAFSRALTIEHTSTASMKSGSGMQSSFRSGRTVAS